MSGSESQSLSGLRNRGGVRYDCKEPGEALHDLANPPGPWTETPLAPSTLVGAPANSPRALTRAACPARGRAGYRPRPPCRPWAPASPRTDQTCWHSPGCLQGGTGIGHGVQLSKQSSRPTQSDDAARLRRSSRTCETGGRRLGTRLPLLRHAQVHQSEVRPCTCRPLPGHDKVLQEGGWQTGVEGVGGTRACTCVRPKAQPPRTEQRALQLMQCPKVQTPLGNPGAPRA